MRRGSLELRAWLISTTTLALALAVPALLSLGRPNLRVAATLVLVAGATQLLGRACALIFRLPRWPGFIAAAETIIGFAALSLLQLAVAPVFHLDAAPSMAVSAALVCGLFFAWGRLPPPAAGNNSGVRWPWADAAVLLALSLLVTLWSREALTALRVASGPGGLFPAWLDFFVHAVQVNYVAHPSWFGGHSPLLAGSPQIVYHEGSYSLAAAFAGLAGVTALQATLGFWLPAGLLLLGLGAYGCACALGGRLTGVAAALGLFLVPDASRYGWGSRFFGFQWVTQVCPASGYGIALILIGLGVFVLGFRSQRSGLLFVGAGLAAVSGLFKVQTAFPAIPLFAVLVFASWRPHPRWIYWTTLALCAGLAAGAVLAFEHIFLAPHFLTGRYEALRFFAFAHAEGAPGPARLYAAAAGASPWMRGVLGTLLALIAALGAILPALIAVQLVPGRERRAWQIQFIPFLLLGGYLMSLFLVPSPITGDFTEFSHRPLPAVYAVLFVFLVAELVPLGRGRAFRPGLRRGLLIACGPLAAAALVADWRASAQLQQDVASLRTFAQVRFSPGFLEATAYIRDHAQPGDWVLSSDADPLGIVAGLTERAAFISRIDLFRAAAGPINDLATERYRLGPRLQGMRSYGELQAFGREQHVRWFLLQPGEMPGWPAALQASCKMQRDGSRVFDLLPSEL